MTPANALARSVSLLGEASDALAGVDHRDVPVAHRQIFRAVAETMRVAHAYVESAVALGELAVVPPPRPAPGVHRGGDTLYQWKHQHADHVVGPLQTPTQASFELGITEQEVLGRMTAGDLPKYELGQGLVQTRASVARGAARHAYLSDQQVSAETAAAYLGVPRKWIYNHGARLPRYEGPTGAKSFSILELEWYLETFAQVESPGAPR